MLSRIFGLWLLIALLLSAALAAYFAVTGDPGSISFDLFVLFYGGLARYTVAGCLMVPVFVFQKIAGVESAPNEVISMMGGGLFRHHKKADAKRGASRPPISRQTAVAVRNGA